MKFFKILLILLLFVPTKLIKAEIDYDELHKAAVEKINQLPKKEIDGQNKIAIGLDDLVTYYVTLSRSSRQVILNQLAAAENVDVASGVFTPRLALSAQGSRGAPNFSDTSTATQPATTSQSAQLSQLTSWGISYYALITQGITTPRVIKTTTSTDYDLKDANVNTNDKLFYQSGTLGLHVPLWKNLGTAGSTGVKKQEVAALKAKTTAAQAFDSQANLIIGTYWNIASLYKNIESLQAGVNLSTKLQTETNQRVNLGLLPISDKLQVDYRLLQDKNSYLQAKNNLINYEDRLKDALDLDSLEYGFYPADELSVPNFDYNEDQLAKLLLDNSKEIKSLKYDRQTVEYDKLDSENLRRYKLDLDLSYSIYGYGSNRSDTKVINDKDTNGYTAGLTFELPLGDNGGFAATRASEYRLAAIDLQFKNLESEAKLQAKEILRQIKLYQDQITAQQVSVDLAKNLLTRELQLYDQGQVTIKDIDEYQQKNLQAQQLLIQVTGDYLKYFYAVVFQIGQGEKYFPRLTKLIQEVNS